MGISFSPKSGIINVSFYKIDYEKVLRLFESLKIDNVSVFVYNGHKYCFKKIIPVREFKKYVTDLKESTLIFDDEVTECFMDKELEILSNKKILVDFNLGENLTCILINTNIVGIGKKEIKRILM